MSMKKFLALVLLCLFGFGAVTAQAWENVTYESIFTDQAFRNYVREEFDTNSNDIIEESEINAINSRTTLDISYKKIASLNGITNFKELSTLDCSGNSLSGDLNLNSLTNLSTLRCNNNRLTGLTVTACTKLSTLYCGYNSLEGTLDLTAQLDLVNLDATYNPKLNITLPPTKKPIDSTHPSGHIGLKTLRCSQVNSVGPLNSDTLCGNLDEFRIANLTAGGPETIDLTNGHDASHSMYLSVIDVSGNPNLKEIKWWTAEGQAFYGIKTFNISGTSLDIQGTINTLTARSFNPTRFYAQNLGLTTLDLSKFTDIEVLYLSNNALKSLTLPESVSSKLYAYLSYNSFDVMPTMPKNTYYMDISYNGLTSLGTNLPDTLNDLDASNNKLTSLGTLPSSLTKLYVNNNALTSLGNLPDGLTTLSAYENKIATANLSNITALWHVQLNSNDLTSLTLPTTSSSSYNLYFYLQNNKLASMPTFPDKTGYIDVSNNLLTSLGTLPSALEELYASKNSISALDLSNHISLDKLALDSNDLTQTSLTLPTGLTTPSYGTRTFKLKLANNKFTAMPTMS